MYEQVIIMRLYNLASVKPNNVDSGASTCNFSKGFMIDLPRHVRAIPSTGLCLLPPRVWLHDTIVTRLVAVATWLPNMLQVQEHNDDLVQLHFQNAQPSSGSLGGPSNAAHNSASCANNSASCATESSSKLKGLGNLENPFESSTLLW